MKTKKIIVCLVCSIIGIFACTKEQSISEKKDGLPTVETSQVTEITTSDAKCGGIIITDGNLEITTKGVCWGVSENPTIQNEKTNEGIGIDSYTSSITNLTSNTLYYVRAYATNANGTAYGNQVSFTSLEGGYSGDFGSFTDTRDNKTYKTIEIGTQTWMAENLAYLPEVCGSSNNCGYWVYSYNGTNVTEAKATTNYSSYGVLYNYEMASNACPSGWHLATDDEWTTLQISLGMSTDDENKDGWIGNKEMVEKMKDDAGWVNYLTLDDASGNNESGFTAKPGGVRHMDGFSGFNLLTKDGYWWTATEYSQTESYFRYLSYPEDIWRKESNNNYGYSVRCIKD